MHVIAAKALAFGEALQPEFINYSTQVIANAKALVARLEHHGFSIVTGGTDCHMVLLDLRTRGVTGKQAQEALDAAGLTCNKNSVPGDPEKPTVTSGIRLGTPSVTSRGMGLAEMVRIADWIAEVVTAVAGAEKDAGRMTRTIDAVRADVEALCQQFPLTV
jgi:glycine hydroxymethyltransferase